MAKKKKPEKNPAMDDDSELVTFEVIAERPQKKRGKLKLLVALVSAGATAFAAFRRYQASGSSKREPADGVYAPPGEARPPNEKGV